MKLQPIKINGAWLHAPIRIQDSRGHFEEQFKLSLIEAELGRSFPVRQVNQSLSKKGVLRGIHWTDSQEGQAKYVSCPRGAIWDVVVDLRPNSPTYGEWDAHVLSEENGASMFISEGLGHAFLAIEDGTVANYLCTSEYLPSSDRTINPMDSTLAVDFAGKARELGIDKLYMSEKDKNADSFH
jgi:dTDP-4-dehydrorhamnose 3,5-epimerase